MKKFFRTSFSALLLLLLLPLAFPALTAAQEPKLTWDPPIPATDILGYKVYIGTSPGQYTRSVDVGNQMEVPLSTLEISGGITYYIAVKSYSATQESPGFSNEINTDYLLVSAGNGTVITETQGGPFQSSINFTLKNLGSRTLTWRASTPDSWLSLSSSEGSLNANETVTITASIHNSAASFLPGDYNGSITFENSTNSQGNVSIPILFHVVSSGGTVSPSPSPTPTPTPTPTPPPLPSPVPSFQDGPGKLFVSAETQATLTELQGGPFSSSIKFVLTNIGGETLTWAATTQRWVKLSPAGGELKSGATVTISASIDDIAASFQPGTYYASISFRNNTNGQGNISMPLRLRVNVPAAGIIGIFRKEAGLGFWYFDDNGNGQWDGCVTDGCHGPFGGGAGDVPLIGNWDGKGKKIAIYREGDWFFDYNGSGTWDDCNLNVCKKGFGGSPEDIPVVGDWEGKGINRIGFYRNGSWFLDNGNGILEACGTDFCLGPFGGNPEDLPVVGDWTGNGASKIGIYRNGQWFLDANGNGKWDGCEIDRCIEAFGGLPGDLPVVGDWAGNGISKIGFYRDGSWYLDYNGNGIWDGCDVDECFQSFGGIPGDLPVVY